MHAPKIHRALIIIIFLSILVFMAPTTVIAETSDASEIKTPAGAAEEIATEYKFIVTGSVRPIKGRGAIESRQAYELVDENNEIYKLIGPKSILDQIIAVKKFAELKFKITGRLIKRDSKKGILMSGYEIYHPQPAGDTAASQNAPAPAATLENTIK